jgi:hypothetical protein
MLSNRIRRSDGAEQAQRSTRLTIALGISAIDVLCCALVGGLVLFLILSVEGRNHKLAGRGGPNRDLVVMLLYDNWNPPPVLRLRVTPGNSPSPGKRAGGPTEYWTDGDRRRDAGNMFLESGGASWSVVPDATEVGERMAILHLRRPVPGDWGLTVGYVESADGVANGPAIGIPVTIRVQSSSGSAECRLLLPINRVFDLATKSLIEENGGLQLTNCTDDFKSALRVGAYDSQP